MEDHINQVIDALGFDEATDSTDNNGAVETGNEEVAQQPTGKTNIAGAAAAASTEDVGGEVTDPNEPNGNLADPDPNALPEDVESLPRVQELIKKEAVAQSFLDALAEGYSIDTEDPAKALEELKQERADAHALYDIVNGRLDASHFLDLLQSNYQPQTVQRVFGQLAMGLERSGFLSYYLQARGLTVAPAQGGDPNAQPNAPQAPNPLEQKVDALMQHISARDQAAQAQQIQVERQRVGAAFIDKVKALCTEKGVDPDFQTDYCNSIAAQIKGNPAILKRISGGNFVDVQRLFTLHHNNQIARYEKWSRAKATAKQTRNAQIPKVPAGGSPPAPAGAPTRRNLTSWEGRTGAVVDALGTE